MLLDGVVCTIGCNLHASYVLGVGYLSLQKSIVVLSYGVKNL